MPIDLRAPAPSAPTGLSEEEAARRLREDGPNEVQGTRRRNVAAIAFEVMREPMFVLLLAAAAIYVALGEPRDALVLGAAVVIVIAITLYQEVKTERALEALRDLSSPRALVIRDGERKRIAGRDVVRGDVMVLAEGDRVAADATLLAAGNLTVDESLLTGESVPVRKTAAAQPPQGAAPGGDDLPLVFSGTLVVTGTGIAMVTATGGATVIGRIGKALESLGDEQTPLQRETRRLVAYVAAGGLGACIVAALAFTLLRGNWLEGLLLGVSLAISLLPEEFPVILTVFLALGAWRIARANVLTRRMPAIEALGAATVLCTDKTGTLTRNRMRVSAVVAEGMEHALDAQTQPDLPRAAREVLRCGAMASQEEPFDPMERALLDAAKPWASGNGAGGAPGAVLAREYPLSDELLAVSRAWRLGEGDEVVVAAKGAPEAIAALCRLEGAERVRMLAQAQALAARGLRVLGVAGARLPADALPERHEALHLRPLGLVAFEDPLRPAVPDAVRQCYAAGVRIIMITGDHPATAGAIARQAGMRDAEAVVTGPELDALDDEAFAARVAATNVFARIVPEQKLRLVRTLQQAGEIVAMTGDGVNDAPALRASHIGIAMGARGTDVAREAADLVLLDDDFSSIVSSIRLGRRIFDNLRKAMAYVVAVHVPIAGIALVPVLFNLPLLLLPVHIVFLELIIDPTCSVAFEAEPPESDVMARPPRRRGEPIVSGSIALTSVLRGTSVLAVSLGALAFALVAHLPDEAMRAVVFATFVLANLALILTSLSARSLFPSAGRPGNRAAWLIVGGTTALLAAMLAVPALRDVFGFAALGVTEIAVVAGLASVVFAWLALLRLRFGS
ncbi:MAG TPA: cation-translocating P-type ATPase [Candidatus Dormibacteraeota bacterium]|nr:cation-translocating P-type ATPase [Candidatus Dormibacteraeota bacterium]